MAKPLPKRVPSDDCAVLIDGAVYYPHEGEYVDVMPGMSVGELQSIEHLRRLGVEIQALEGEPDAQSRLLALLDPHYEELYRLLAARLVAWNWTDDRGRAIGPPDDVANLRTLRPEELYYLLFAAQGETPGARKNGWRPSQTISSAIASMATAEQNPTEGHNRGQES